MINSVITGQTRLGIVRCAFSAILLAGSIVAGSSASLTEVPDFGPNPTNLKMFLYVPDNIGVRPAVMVGVHWCHGTAQNFYSGNQYRSLANQYKFIMIYPNANSSDSCFDVHSKGTLTHDGGGDALGIASMVRYVIKNNNGDSTRVYAAGHSSGGMMCNVLAGSYPDLFKAVSASAGVPFGCFGSGSSYWNDSCAKGKIVKSGQEWGDLVRSAFPQYTGVRPRIQLWHGMNDDILAFVNFEEAIEQWTNVLGVSATATGTETNAPKSGYTRMHFTDSNGAVIIEAIKAANQTHNVPIVDLEVIRFFGLDKPPTAVETPACLPPSAASLHLTSTGCGIHCTVAARPGRIGLALYRLDGSRVASLAEQYRADGRLDAVLRVNHALPSVFIATISVDGKTVASRRCMFGMLPACSFGE